MLRFLICFVFQLNYLNYFSIEISLYHINIVYTMPQSEGKPPSSLFPASYEPTRHTLPNNLKFLQAMSMNGHFTDQIKSRGVYRKMRLYLAQSFRKELSISTVVEILDRLRAPMLVAAHIGFLLLIGLTRGKSQAVASTRGRDQSMVLWRRLRVMGF